jgi:Ca2+-binding RTX toxin-like protein
VPPPASATTLDNVLVGNKSANILEGGAGDDLLDGGKGADVMRGGLGDDIYIVDNKRDVAVEQPGEGIDTVRNSAAFTLPEHVENLELLGKAKAGTGNDLANVITGNAGKNTLVGGAGDDTLIGLGGTDIARGWPGRRPLRLARACRRHRYHPQLHTRGQRHHRFQRSGRRLRFRIAPMLPITSASRRARRVRRWPSTPTVRRAGELPGHGGAHRL